MELNTVRGIPYCSLHTHVLFSINCFNSTDVMNRITNFICRAKTRQLELCLEKKTLLQYSLLKNNLLQVLQISRTGVNCPKGIAKGVK